MGKTNQEWHAEHRMPKNPTPLERVAWHEAHRKHCACRPVPQSILKMMPPSSQQS